MPLKHRRILSDGMCLHTGNSSRGNTTDRRCIHTHFSQATRVSIPTDDQRSLQLPHEGNPRVSLMKDSTNDDIRSHHRFTDITTPIIHTTNENTIPKLSKLDSFGFIASRSSEVSDTSSFWSLLQRIITKSCWDGTEEKRTQLSWLPKKGDFIDAKILMDAEGFSLDNGTHLDTDTMSLAATNISVKNEILNIPMKRRRIFSRYLFCPPLDTDYDKSSIARASSTSILLEKPPSILRNVKSYSSALQGSTIAAGRPRSSSVSFNPEVDVHEFQKPHEFHAHDGWRTFFT